MTDISIKKLMKKVTLENQPRLDDGILIGKERLPDDDFEYFQDLRDCELLQKEMKSPQKGKTWNTLRNKLTPKLS